MLRPASSHRRVADLSTLAPQRLSRRADIVRRLSAMITAVAHYLPRFRKGPCSSFGSWRFKHEAPPTTIEPHENAMPTPGRPGTGISASCASATHEVAGRRAYAIESDDSSTIPPRCMPRRSAEDAVGAAIAGCRLVVLPAGEVSFRIDAEPRGFHGGTASQLPRFYRLVRKHDFSRRTGQGRHSRRNYPFLELSRDCAKTSRRARLLIQDTWLIDGEVLASPK